MVATKDQERKALAQIKKIVEGLGEDSYVAAAFEGCFEMAENNINDDFGCSWKQTAEKALEDEKYFKDLAERKAAENEKLQKQFDDMSKMVLNRKDLTAVRTIVLNQYNETVEKLHKSESKIVEFCEDTDSNDFQSAVENHRAYKEKVNEYLGLQTRLHTIDEAY